MKSIILTKHILEQVSMRRKITWYKAKVFLEQKFEDMFKNENKIITDASGWLSKIVVWREKIVYEDMKDKFVLITYIKKTEYDKIEYSILQLIKYHEKKNKNK